MNMFVGAGFYARLPKAHASYVRGDVGIAPYENAKCPCVIRAGGQSRPLLHTF